jgi:Zn-dependent protease with chaperone function
VTAPGSASATTQAAYFDGQSARARPVELQVVAGRLLIVGEGVSVQVPVADVQWPERTRHGPRVAHLRSGGSLQALDASAWDRWAQASGLRESLVVKAQQNWRSTLAAVLVLLALGGATYLWGVPWLGRSALAVVPLSVDRAVGEAAQQSLDHYLLRPSQVPVQRQQQVREAFANAVARADPQRRWPAYELNFATSAVLPDPTHRTDKDAVRRTRLGPNAFALPGGIVYVTDDMLELLQGRDDVLIGVLAHELGHVKRRHGMRLVVQATVLGAVASLVWGDFSTLLATVPVLLGQNAYSRDFEREADLDAIAMLRANGLSPAVMAELFERLAAKRAVLATAASGAAGKGGVFDGDLGIAFASHPDDAERIQRFRDAAR